MEDSLNSIILKYFFYRHNNSNLSRFHELFKYIKKYEINIDKIMSGKDKRTTIVVQNLSTLLNRNIIKEIVDKFGNTNFIYITKEQNINKCYINVVNYKSIINIVNGLQNILSTFELEIYYSQIQGKKNLINKFIES